MLSELTDKDLLIAFAAVYYLYNASDEKQGGGKLLMRHLLKEHLLIAVVKTFQKVRSLTTKQL